MSLRDWLRGAFGKSARGTQARCLACDSTELVFLAADAYQCSSCGHEGGDGLPAYLAARKRSQIAAMSPEQRIALVHKHLGAVRNLLSGVDLAGAPGIQAADVAAAVINASVKAVLHVSPENTKDKLEEQRRVVAAAYRDLMESEQLLDEVATALSGQLQIPPTHRMAAVPLQLDHPQTRARLVQVAHMQRGELDRFDWVVRG
jgi:hypothetical protein